MPFGLITGVASTQLGFDAWSSLGASAIMFAGAAQLATYELLANNAPWLVVISTAALINARFFLYSVSIAPWLADQPRLKRVVYGYVLTDQAYAMTAARQTRTPAAAHRAAYYFGCASAFWVMWMVTSFVGAAAGAAIPASWSLDFAVPLCFAALLVPAIKDRAQVVCALVTAAVSIVAMRAPQGSGTLISITIGTVVGAWLARRIRT